MHRLVIALVTLIGLTGAFVVGTVLFLSGASTDRAASLAPESTAAYVNVYLQPSAGQQMNLGQLIGRLPGFADDAALDDKIDQIAQRFLGETGIDYEADLKPWIGSQIAVAAWPDDAAEFGSRAVVIAEVRDLPAAETALPSLLNTDPGDFSTETYNGAEIHVADAGAYAFSDEMLVAGQDADSVRAAIDAGRGASLADRADFRATLDGLPADHLASAFIDLAGFAEAAGGEEIGGLSTAGFEPGLGAPPQIALEQGEERGTHWVPAECDVSIRPGWYWRAEEDDAIKSLPALLEIWHASVGRGANLLLNLPVDRVTIHPARAAA